MTAATIRRVLVAVDASPGSDDVVAHALLIARAVGAQVQLVTVLPPPDELVGLLPDGSAAVDALAAWRDGRALATRVLAAAGAGGPTVEVRVETGRSPVAAIVALAASVDLVVMGTHRRRGVARLLHGSVADEVVRRAPCPVLIVPLPPGSPPGDGAAGR